MSKNKIDEDSENSQIKSAEERFTTPHHPIKRRRLDPYKSA